ncbi:hypothetical protein PFISCL1PPCAC_9384, partial [Pristionchus fissidentatus]
GSFSCPLCTRQFAHSASLSRHRLNVHSGCHYCLQCREAIPDSSSLRDHFSSLHGFDRVFTCACCNWAFPCKKSLIAHVKNKTNDSSPSLIGVLAITDKDTQLVDDLDTLATPPTVLLSSPTVSPP